MNRKALVQKKFPKQFAAALAVEDPSQGKNKYLLWIAQQLKNGHNAADISSTVKFFHDNPDRFAQKDIHKYKDLKELEDLIKEMGLSKRKEKAKDKEGAEKIFENDDFLCVRVDDKPAMITYGSNTKWCTTMKDQQYYEDYVNQGNDFYILITKNSKVIRSSKYAVVRRGLLEFQVYDAKDSYSRSFTEEEEDRLREVVQAIVADKPPKNYLREVCAGNIPAAEAAEWMKTQSKVTREYIEGKRPDLQLLCKTTNELIDIFANPWQRRHLGEIEYEKLLEVARTLSGKKDKKTELYGLKGDLVDKLRENDKLIFASDCDARIRTKVAAQVTGEQAKEFFGDRSLSVFRSAARHVEIDYLFDFAEKTKSTRKKRAANEVIIERISQEKVRAFVLNQPRDTIKSLMD
jgi:hypothetical protein